MHDCDLASEARADPVRASALPAPGRRGFARRGLTIRRDAAGPDLRRTLPLLAQAPAPRRLCRVGALAALVALAGLPGIAAATGGCSPYMGQMVINEVRIGKSNATEPKNQIEFYNAGNVDPSIWSTWSIVVYGGDSAAKSVKKGTYKMSSGWTTANTSFVYNNTLKMWARNGDNSNKPRAYDAMVLDANGDIVDYIAIGVGTQTVPGCFGAKTTIKATNGGDNTGDAMRAVDATGAWPAQVPKQNWHTIGRTNVCTSGSNADLVVSISPDFARAVQNTTVVTYEIDVVNVACSANAGGIHIKTTNTDAANFNGLATTKTVGSVAVSGTGYDWNIGTINAGVAQTMTISGTPKNLGTLVSTAYVSAHSGTLANTGDDTDSTTLAVQQYNYVGLDTDVDDITEGADASYSAQLDLDVPSTKSVSVAFTVTGTAVAGTDYTLDTPSPVTIASGDSSATIDFTILNDAIHEGTKTLIVTVTSVTSTDATVKIGTVPLGYIVAETVTLYDDDPLDHFELALASTGLACVASTVSLTACLDASSPCTNKSTVDSGATATLATSAGALGATTVTFDATGVATTTLSYPAASNGAAATVTLSGETVSARNSRQCCPVGGSCSVANSCGITFNTAGFIVGGSAGGAAATIPSQTAGTSSAGYYLRAVKTNSTTKACEAALSGSTSVNWAYQCNNPTTCSAGNRMTLTGNSATTIAANPNGGVSTYLPVTMTFDANGNAPFSFNYSDVGQVTLYATKAAGGALLTSLSGSSNAFVVKPAGFTLSAIKCTNYAAGSCATAAIASPGNNPGAAAAAGTAFIPAGKAFSATVTATDSAGNAVPNFGRESSPEGVTLTANLVQPVGGSAPALTNPSAFGAFSGGAATGTTFAWSEAGIITLSPRLTSSNYLGGAGAVTGTTSGNVGRFYADHLTVGVAPGCSGSFTYAGQPFTASITATNAAGSALANYGGATFAKAVTLSDAGALGLGSLAGTNVAAAAFANGVASGTPTYTYTSKLTGPATLTVRAADTDGASSSGFTEGSTELRSGRLRLANGFGRETAALQLTAQAEYWTGAAWLLNGGDSCTSVPAAAVALSNKLNGQGSSTNAWSTSASAITLASGSGTLTLTAPSPTATGSIDIGLNLGATAADQSCLASHPASTGAGASWLRSRFGSCAATFDRDPSARASFGIYSPETRKTVHARELF